MGEILDRLEADGLADDTIVVFFADQGRLAVRGNRLVLRFGQPPAADHPLAKEFRRPAGISPRQGRRPACQPLGPYGHDAGLRGHRETGRMQSRVFLGPNADPPRRYVFTHRDRHDEVVQRIRSVRSERYRYIRNYIPERPFMFYHGHQRAMYPVISLLDRLHKEGKLDAVQGATDGPASAGRRTLRPEERPPRNQQPGRLRRSGHTAGRWRNSAPPWTAGSKKPETAA